MRDCFLISTLLIYRRTACVLFGESLYALVLLVVGALNTLVTLVFGALNSILLDDSAFNYCETLSNRIPILSSNAEMRANSGEGS